MIFLKGRRPNRWRKLRNFIFAAVVLWVIRSPGMQKCIRYGRMMMALQDTNARSVLLDGERASLEEAQSKAKENEVPIASHDSMVQCLFGYNVWILSFFGSLSKYVDENEIRKDVAKEQNREVPNKFQNSVI
jgi:hypothetical protein